MEGTNKSFRENVSKIIEERGMSQRDLAKKVGCTHEHLNAVLKGRTKPSNALMEAVAEALDMDYTELIIGPAEQIKKVAATHERYGGKKIMTWVPLLQTKHDQDSLLLRVSDMEAPIAFKTDWLFQLGTPDKMAFIRTSGKNLDGEIPDSSMVMVDREQTVPIDGAPFFIRIKQNLAIKRVFNGEGGLTAYDDIAGTKGQIQLDADQDWNIIGRCVWFGKSLS